jgi:outer membrane protein OmpA-like peptidoglycan-associated protein/ABC-type nitrate/sulfonate/bicarbonate transport system substrate-binding protein
MFLSNVKPLPRALILLVGVGAIIGGAKWAIDNTKLGAYVAPKPTVAIAVPDKIDLPTTPAEAIAMSHGAVINAPAVAPQELRVKVLAWNAVAGAAYAKSAGLYKAKGLTVDIKREDDYSKMTADLASFAKDPAQGVHFVVIMGDGYPAFSIGANAALKPFGSHVAGIAGIGYSRGEDKCIIADGVEPRGALVKGVLGDGDINICVKWAADNGIPVNADTKIYDPNALNLTNAKDFVEADQAFIASMQKNFQGGACEDRTVAGTGKMQKVCVTGTATWTPGDTNVFNQFKAGGKSIRVLASTKDYAWQMSALVIGNKEWMSKHRDVVKAFLAATFEGGEKVRTDNAALMVAAAEEAKIFGEQDASYWASLFRGTVEAGPNGKPIALGGSTTNSLADSAYLFGLNGADNLFKKVYTVYGKIAVQYFPDIMPGGLQKYEDVIDTSYMQELLTATGDAGKAVTPTFNGASTVTVASKSVSIEFETGKATFTPKAMAALNDVLDQAAVTSLSLQINGHTDTVGSPTSNLELSKARAEAVKKFLMTNAPTSFPAERVTTRGYGDTMPIGTNAQNRRVEILLRK